MSTSPGQPVAAPLSGRGKTALMVSIGLGILVVVIAIVVVVVWLFSGPEQLVTRYGRHQVPGEPGSVNGIDALAAMFDQQGHSIYYRHSIITSEMKAADTIVWFPNDFAPPSEELCLWFDDWLAETPGRTLIYVGRDFDAAPLYRDFVEKSQGSTAESTDKDARQQPSDLAAKMQQATEHDAASQKDEKNDDAPDDEKSDEANTDEDSPDAADADKEHTDDEPPAKDARSCEWFVYRSEPLEPVTELAGPWSEGVDAAKAGVWLGTRIDADGDRETLLAAGDGVLVEQLTWPYWEGSQLLLVANGSFLLNLPLVNHQNRELAGRLIASASPAGRVVFLESGPGGPAIDPEGIDHSLWTLLGAWPLNVILLQLAAVGVIFCFARWPIFGRPKQPPAEVTSDFSKHVAAVGQLLSRTHDRAFLSQTMPPPLTMPPQTLPGESSPPPALDAQLLPPSDTKGS